MIHTFEASLFLGMSREAVFEFFADADNPPRITPPIQQIMPAH